VSHGPGELLQAAGCEGDAATDVGVVVMNAMNVDAARVRTGSPSMHGRRCSGFRAMLWVSLAAAAVPGRAASQAPLASRPNIVFVLTDDLDSASPPMLPALNALLGDKGITFSQFFVSDSLCCPSRASILCGQYNHNHRVLTNNPPHGGYERFNELGLEGETVARWLHDAGYRTVLMGKYLNGYPAVVGPSWIPAGWDEWYVPVDGTPYEEFAYTMTENRRLVVYGERPSDYMVDVLAATATAFIRAAAASDQPFFMYIAPYAPHFPYTPAPRYAGAFAGTMAPHSPSFNEADVGDKPKWVSKLPPLTPSDIENIDLTFQTRLESMLAVQDLVAALVGALEAAGKLDNTYLFFTSDNGYHLGEHRLMPGKQTPYEEDLRVPLVVRGPGVPAHVTLPHLVGNIDFAPTFLELAGVAPHDEIDGRSMAPLLRSDPPPPEDWRQAYLLEHTEEKTHRLREGSLLFRAPPHTLEPPDPQAFLIRPRSYVSRIPNFHGLRLRDSVYIEYETGERELYDLRTDPWELTNLASSAPPAQLTTLAFWLAAMRGCAGPTCRTADQAQP
jgi:N-acetylglucosamine-6-sulfatase